MKRLLFLAIALFGFMLLSYSQTNPQREIMSHSHIRVNKPITYVVDYLMLDRATFLPIELQEADVKRIRVNTQVSIVYITTTLAVVLNGELLLTQKEKEKLAAIQLADIELIQKIEKEQAIELYGKKGKRGVLVINTRSK